MAKKYKTKAKVGSPIDLPKLGLAGRYKIRADTHPNKITDTYSLSLTMKAIVKMTGVANKALKTK